VDLATGYKTRYIETGSWPPARHAQPGGGDRAGRWVEPIIAGQPGPRLSGALIGAVGARALEPQHRRWAQLRWASGPSSVSRVPDCCHSFDPAPGGSARRNCACWHSTWAQINDKSPCFKRPAGSPQIYRCMLASSVAPLRLQSDVGAGGLGSTTHERAATRHPASPLLAAEHSQRMWCTCARCSSPTESPCPPW